MSTPFNTVRRFISGHSMIDSASGVLVAVSGGVDSVVMVDMLVRLTSSGGASEPGARDRREEALTQERSEPRLETAKPHLHFHSRTLSYTPKIHVAHLDHMLRGRESAEDSEFVRGLAERLGLQISVRSVDIRALAESAGRGIEEVAREVRYNFLFETARETGCDRIAVGHTMSDQAETFLMRLVRGAGMRGLAAMRPVTGALSFSDYSREKAEGRRQKAEVETAAGDESLPAAFCLLPSVSRLPPSILLIRPLLCIKREEVEAYAAEHRLAYRTDSTNRDVQYTRNRIRYQVLPELRAVNPRIEESIARAANNIAGDQDVLDQLARSVLRGARLGSGAWFNEDTESAAYSVSALAKEPAGLRRRMIIEAIRLMRSVLPGGNRVYEGEFDSVQLAAIEALLEPDSSGKHIKLPGGLEVWREFGALVFKSVAKEVDGVGYVVAINAARPCADAGGFAFTLKRGQPIEVLTSTRKEAQAEAKRTGRDWMSVAFDDAALPDSLVIRPRLTGERAQVVGHRKLIKLKNLMIDHRIPSSRRASWPVVTTPDGFYVWSPGLPPALKFAAHDGTNRIAIMRASVT